ncbi:MAG: hypothetical protein WBB00_23650 [Mycobacterium sp.]
MGSRARVAAAACVAASGLLFGGVGSAVAVADPGQTTGGDTSGRQTDAASSADDRPDTGESEGDPSRSDREGDKRDGAAGSRGDQESGDDAEPAVREDDGTVDPDDGTVDPKAEADPEVPPRDEDGEKEPPPPCCDDGEDDCWPWPWPWPQPDTDPPHSGSDGGYPGRPPVELPFPVPPVGLPPEFPPPVGEPIEPEIVDTVPGVGVAGGFSGAPVSVPVLVVAPTGLGPGPTGLGAGPAGGGGSSLPAAPRQGPAEPPRVREPQPATVGGAATLPASSFRVGYGEYLRSAGMAQIAVLAVPGLLGILVLTGAGGFVGYRQAKAGHAVRHSGVGRYMN